MRVSIRVVLAILFSLSLAAPAAAQSGSVSGVVRSAETGRPLALASVSVGKLKGTATDGLGRYSLDNLKKGRHRVTVSYVGYASAKRSITIVSGERLELDIYLWPGDLQIDEVTVTAFRTDVEDPVGVRILGAEHIYRAPGAIEPDLFRSLHLIPGIKAASDYSSALYVRGGSPDQTLILFDGAPIYNPSHFYGIFSSFNPDAVDNVRLYKGGYPAKFGGRLGSVVDIRGRQGSQERSGGSLSLGMLASRFHFEGPVGGRASFFVAARRSTLEPVLGVLRNQDIDGTPRQFYFYDINGRFSVNTGSRSHLTLSLYDGKDRLDLPVVDDATLDVRYGNQIASLKWVGKISDGVSHDLKVSRSRYFAQPTFDVAGTPVGRRNKLEDLSAQFNLEFDRGISTTSLGVGGGTLDWRLVDSFDETARLDEDRRATYASSFIEQRLDARLWNVSAGLRGSYFSDGAYYRLEPRAAVGFSPIEQLDFQVRFGRFYQNLTLLTSELFTGSDVWLTAGEGVRPSYSDQIGGGLSAGMLGGRLGLEGYYRSMVGLFEIDPLIPDYSGLTYKELFRFGSGYAYGVEFDFDRRHRSVDVYSGYTYGVTRRRFDEFESAKIFAPKYDRTHEINTVLGWNAGAGWRFTAAFTAATGQAFTRPIGQYRLVTNPFGSQVKNVLESPFNEARLPAYHRLDIGIEKSGFMSSSAEYNLRFNVVNVYGSRNIWFYYYAFENDHFVTRKDIPQIPVPLPTLSLTLKFGGSARSNRAATRRTRGDDGESIGSLELEQMTAALQEHREQLDVSEPDSTRDDEVPPTDASTGLTTDTGVADPPAGKRSMTLGLHCEQFPCYVIVVGSDVRLRDAQVRAQGYLEDVKTTEKYIAVLNAEVAGKRRYRVGVGPYLNLDEARRVAAKMSDRVPDVWILQLDRAGT